jgi:hypothetical protein
MASRRARATSVQRFGTFRRAATVRAAQLLCCIHASHETSGGERSTVTTDNGATTPKLPPFRPSQLLAESPAHVQTALNGRLPRDDAHRRNSATSAHTKAASSAPVSIRSVAPEAKTSCTMPLRYAGASGAQPAEACVLQELRSPEKTSRSRRATKRTALASSAHRASQHDRASSTRGGYWDARRVHVRSQGPTRPGAASVQQFGAFPPAASGDAARAAFLLFLLP